MNNQIFCELEKKAFDSVWNLEIDPIGPSTHFRPDGFEQAFARLIALDTIKDCRDMFVVNSISWNLLNDKLEHFGVEE